MNILEQLADHAKRRVEMEMRHQSLAEIREKALYLKTDDFPFEKALGKKGLSFIAECKKASPSKGLIAKDYDYLKTAKEYEEAGADVISVLTEDKWFLGDKRHLEEIARNVKIPCLRKDFIISSYQIYETKLLGASAILLICALLGNEKLKEYLIIANELGLSALVEAHDEEEIEMAINAKARIIGINNRNLKDFSVNLDNARKLRKLIPAGIIFVAESGIRNRQDIRTLEEIGADAVLIGELLMRAEDKMEKLKELKGQ